MLTKVLDSTDLKILYELDKSFRIPDSSIAKNVGISKQSVKKRIDKLVDNEVIKKFVVVINMANFGVIPNQIYISLHSSSEKRKIEFIDYLINEKAIAQVTLCEGIYDLFFGITGNNIYEIEEFLSVVFTKFYDIIKEKKITIIIDTRLFPRDYLIDKNREIIPNNKGFHQRKFVKQDIKEIDNKILNILCLNPRIQIVDIASQLDSNVQTIINRIKFLEKNCIIRGYMYLTNEKIMMQHTILIELSSMDNNIEQKLFQYLSSCPNVIFIVKYFGEYNFAITTECKNFNEHRNFCDSFKKEFSNNIKSFIPLFIHDIKKMDLLPPDMK
ncbi:MAG: Lrp/AsnC family transcriptional regulator [Nanoarchaeota archaeon]